MKLCWVVNGSLGGAKGRVYGYLTHRTELRKAVEALGVQVTSDVGGDYDLAIHVVTANNFRPLPGKRNILATTLECTAPSLWSEDVHEADCVIVPCRHNLDVLSRYYNGSIYIVPEGIQPEYTFAERRMPGSGEPFRFLFHGNCGDSLRKGPDIVVEAFKGWFRLNTMPKNAQLIIKTSEAPQFPEPVCRMGAVYDPRFPGDTLSQNFAFPGLGLEEYECEGLPEIIVDQRDLTIAQLVELYHSAHAFVFPSRGEGWGLTLTQAFATGLPSIYTFWSAMLDYATPEMGYPLYSYEMVRICEPAIPGADPLVAEVETADVVEAMERIYRGYPEALQRGRIASERMRPYTWENAARRFVEACQSVLDGERAERPV